MHSRNGWDERSGLVMYKPHSLALKGKLDISPTLDLCLNIRRPWNRIFR